MHRLTLASLLFVLCCGSVQAQDKMPPALEARLLAFTDQLWFSWMKTGDIRSLRDVRVPEMLAYPACRFIAFTKEDACQQLSNDERADYLQTIENFMGLITYRLLSHEELDENKLEQLGPDGMFTFLSPEELSLMTELTGQATSADDFRSRLPRYEQLEKMFQAAHLKNFEQTRAVYLKNLAILDDKIDEPKVSRVDPSDLNSNGLAPGEYFTVRKGLSIFWLRMSGTQLKFVLVQPVTQ